MARIAVLHNTLDFQGGADTVCLAAIEALQTEHELTLFTLSETRLSALADRFDIPVDDVAVRMPSTAMTIARGLSALAPWIGPQLAFRSVLLHRVTRSWLADFDLAVSTANELSLPIPSVQYVHFPQFHLHRHPDTNPGRLNRLWSRLVGPEPHELDGRDISLLSNSAWTAEVFAEIYGVTPSVLHPPVDPIPCEEDWDARENGVVIVGRLAPDKRLLEGIDIVERVRSRGYDLHLHVIGTAPRSYRHYVNRLEKKAENRPYVHLEQDVSRSRLEALLCSHKFGLNVKEREHFGMSVAEYVAAGMIAFAPAAGGQSSILDDRPDRLFDSTNEAVALLSQALESEDTPDLPRDRFSRDRFHRKFRHYVSRTLH